MIKTILVPMQGGGNKPALAASLAMARLFNAHVECFCVHQDVNEMIARAVPYDVGTATVIPGFIQAFQDEDAALATRARQAFDEWFQTEKIPYVDAPPGPQAVSTSWREETGNAAECITRRARFSDLVVLDNTPNRAQWTPGLASTLLVESGRPLLLAAASPPKHFSGTVAIAWKETPEAARALTAAMPILAKAKRVAVLSADEPTRKPLRCVECIDELTEQLTWHGFNVEKHFVIPGGLSVADALIGKAHEIGAGLLVMGGYSHSRAREFVFGGVTQTILDGAKLPVFMVH